MSSRNNTKRRDTTTPEFYASGDFHGLKFFDTFDDNTDIDKPLICIPDITLLEGNTYAVFDFNHCDFSNEFDQISVIFAGLTIGDGITISDGYHIDEETSEKSDISGYYVVSGKYDKIITANVNSVENPEDYDKKYKKENFTEDISILTSASGISSESKYMIKNFFSSDSTESFVKLGVIPNDQIRFNNGNNAGKLFDISSISVDNNGHEVLGITGGTAGSVITVENRFNASSQFDLFRVDFDEDASTVQVVANPSNNIFFFSPVMNTTTYKYRFSTYTTPEIKIKVGTTYIFHRIGNSVNFSISSTSDGTWNNGIDYPLIVETGNVLILTPTSPGTLYYYDKAVQGAGNKIIVESNTTTFSTYTSINGTTPRTVSQIQSSSSISSSFSSILDLYSS